MEQEKERNFWTQSPLGIFILAAGSGIVGTLGADFIKGLPILSTTNVTTSYFDSLIFQVESNGQISWSGTQYNEVGGLGNNIQITYKGFVSGSFYKTA